MAGTNDFQNYAEGSPGANLMPLADYEASTARQNGVTVGIADETLYNRAARQSAAIAKLIGDFIAATGLDCLDDGNDAARLANLQSALTMFTGRPVQGATKNLLITNDATTPDTVIDISADELVLEDADGDCIKLSSVDVTINYSTSGAGGLDTGALAASTGYNHWVIYNPTTKTVKGLGSLSATAPTMPSGYTFRARVGWNHTDGTSKFYRVRQTNKRAQYVVTSSTNTATMFPLVAGATGNVNTPTYTQVQLSGATSPIVPPTAESIRVSVASISSSNNLAIYAPNSSYGASGSSINPAFASFGGSSVSAGSGTNFDMLLESASIFVAQQTNVVSFINGWDDNI